MRLFGSFGSLRYDFLLRWSVAFFTTRRSCRRVSDAIGLIRAARDVERRLGGRVRIFSLRWIFRELHHVIHVGGYVRRALEQGRDRWEALSLYPCENDSTRGFDDNYVLTFIILIIYGEVF